MLLPSALSCDSAHSATTRTRYQASLFASPPLSPPASTTTTSTTITNIYSTCRALQSMLTPPTPLPSPPTRHAEPPSTPFKLRLRQRKSTEEPSSAPIQRKRITKRSTNTPPRGVNKRRRAMGEDMTREAEFSAGEAESEVEDLPSAPSTPKRARIAPEHLPLGLERSDFHTLHLQQLQPDSQGEEVLESVESDMGEGEWSTEEDRILVELVLEKLKLSKSEWQDCARSLGKDRGSVGRRWKSLMGAGEVGLKNRQRRGKIHGTWR